MIRQKGIRLGVALGLCAALAACGSVPNRVSRVESPAIRPDASGLGIANAEQRVDFGRTQASTVEAVMATRNGSTPISVRRT